MKKKYSSQEKQLILASNADIFWLQSLAMSTSFHQVSATLSGRRLTQTATARANEQYWSLETVGASVWTFNSFGSRSKRQETRPPRRWRVLIQQHMPSGESSGYPCRYYGRRNEAHPFPAAWTMTCGNWGLWWGLVCFLVCHTNSYWLTEQNECLNPHPLHASERRVSISFSHLSWFWLFLLTALQTMP